MSDTEGFVSWEEHIISQERGNRVVHYFVRHTSGNLVLAVEGTERSVRHMIYVVSDTFVEQYGDMCCIDSGTKWRTRREVVNWLTLLVSKHQSRLESLTCGLVQPIHDQTRGYSGNLNPQPPELIPRELKAQICDIVWHGVGRACGKRLVHYPAFRRNGVTISVQSFVVIMAAEGSHYLGYLEDMYEDKKGRKKVRVRWFHHDEEVLGVVSQLNAHPREVFITPHVQVISAECIHGPTAVLTPKHYEQCMAFLPHSILSRVYLCFRQFKDNKIKPFSLSKLQGYCDQAVLACIDHPLLSKNKVKGRKFNADKQGDSTSGDSVKQGGKRKRLGKGNDEDFKERDQMKVDTKRNKLCRHEESPSALGSRMTGAVPSFSKLKIKLSGRIMKHGRLIGSGPNLSTSFKTNDEIELLSQDSGIRGCWFQCKVLQVSEKRLKVQYDDVQDAEKSVNLQEWVSSCRVAAPDKLGMRCSGRLITRPRPPTESSDCVLVVGAPVDVWWCDGWWEGVIITTNVFGTHHLQVYLPGEERYMTIERSHVRSGKDWVNGSWVNAKIKPDILSYISANAGLSISNYAMPPISELEEEKEDGQDPPATPVMLDASLRSVEDNTISFDKGDNDEFGKQPTEEPVCHDVLINVDDERLKASTSRQPYLLAKSVEVLIG